MAQLGREHFIGLLEPVVQRLGFELVDLEANFGSRSSVLRLFIDHEAGVTLDDCEVVSRQVSAVLDVEDPIPGDYNLEVSSPGLNRRLVKPEHFERFAGERVRVRLMQPLDGRRNFKAALLGHEDGKALLEQDGVRYEIPLENIDMARLVPEL
jgi:ribosome maturation factor RimP